MKQIALSKVIDKASNVHTKMVNESNSSNITILQIDNQHQMKKEVRVFKKKLTTHTHWSTLSATRKSPAGSSRPATSPIKSTRRPCHYWSTAALHASRLHRTSPETQALQENQVPRKKKLFVLVIYDFSSKFATPKMLRDEI